MLSPFSPKPIPRGGLFQPLVNPKEINKVHIGKLWQKSTEPKGLFCQVEVEVDGLSKRDQLARAMAQ
jgi:hypothetical protein